MNVAAKQRRPSTVVDEVGTVASAFKRTELGIIPYDWSVIPLWSLAKFTSGEGINVASLSDYSSDWPVPVYGGNGIAGYTDRALVSEPTVVLGRVGQKCGSVYLSTGPAWITDNALFPKYVGAAVHVPFLALVLENAGLNSVRNRNDLPLLTQGILRSVQVAWPHTRAEQRAIAEALSDVDGLLGELEALLSKKRAIKQAAMQQLLTGKTRLPGFSGEWETKKLGDIGRCLRGVSYNPASDLAPHDTASTVRLFRANNVKGNVISTADLQFVESHRVRERQLMQMDDVLVCTASGSRDVVGKAARFHLDDGHPYTFGAFMACFRTDDKNANPAFAFYLFQTGRYRAHLDVTLAGSSINNLRPADIEACEFEIAERVEQDAIATVLSDMDAEIAALERRRDKTRAIKQGMMQQLLTGRVRLVEPEMAA